MADSGQSDAHRKADDFLRWVPTQRNVICANTVTEDGVKKYEVGHSGLSDDERRKIEERAGDVPVKFSETAEFRAY